jgi:hypothetical protein
VSWELATRARVCGGCGARIPAGQPVRLVTDHRRPRCAACAKTSLGEDVPAEFTTPGGGPVGRLVLPSSWQRWMAPNAVDGRMRRAGGDQ